jgi:predicted transcriptional regulator
MDEQPVTETAARILNMTTQIVAAYLASNTVATGSLPELIESVHRELESVEQNHSTMAPLEARPRDTQPVARTAVDVRRSVFPGYLICLEEGGRFKTLRRHLSETHGMTPEQYRAKWDLPETYPMTAPDYSAVRSNLSKANGLGKRR